MIKIIITIILIITFIQTKMNYENYKVIQIKNEDSLYKQINEGN
jgi:hypothetical protein